KHQFLPAEDENDDLVPEEHVGGTLGANFPLTYPSVSSCIGVLCVLADRLTGAHFTKRTPQDIVDGLLDALVTRLNENQPIRSLYFFGPSAQWAEKTKWGDGPRQWKGKGLQAALRDVMHRLDTGTAWW